MSDQERDAWASRMGLILAMAGNAIGLGNFLRFPVQAAQNGGGAFMIPYFAALLLVGIPLMWVEWTIGRHGGQYGYGTASGAFGTLTSSRRGARIANLLGVLGITVPLLFAIFYTYVESWTLAYSFFSITNQYNGLLSIGEMSGFLAAFQGKVTNEHFSGLTTGLIFFFITLFLNVYILSRGISAGIEKLAKIAMPLLFVFAFILVIRVWTLDAPDPAKPENTVFNGFAFLWNPDLSAIGSAKAWLAAAGQIFFTLSIGSGAILTYASYLKRRDDVALTGLTTSMTNEFAEVVLGASIAIPVAVAFFGVMETQMIAKGGSFDLGFVAMPVIFQQLPFGAFFGMLWFLLLFFAGITSSVALCSPAMAFLQDQLKLSRGKAALLVGAVLLFWGLPVVLFLGHGYLDEYDFWAGTFLLVVFSLIEVIIFAWIFGIDRGWAELHEGAQIKVPVVFKYIIKYVAPIYLFGLLAFWGYQDGIPILTMATRNPDDIFYLWVARFSMVLLFVIILGWLFRAYKKGTVRDEH
ncbi:MAG: sodium-dependent transporter [candidate division Zixibacteria bacterium]|nr:sodium-dependent transporter [candidate division Zixibacteria bacterium]